MAAEDVPAILGALLLAGIGIFALVDLFRNRR